MITRVLDLENATVRQIARPLAEAVTIAAARAGAGDVVLLSPACASFDMFTGYANRGDVFSEAVARLREARS